jgi:hypothetical protein
MNEAVYPPIRIPGASMARKIRPWLPYIAFAVALALVVLARSFHKAPPPPPPLTMTATFAPMPSPPDDPRLLPAYLEQVLRSRGMTVRLVPCKNRPEFYDLYAGERGQDRPLALVEVRPGESTTPTMSAPGDYNVGPYHIVGNPGLVTTVHKALPEWGNER